MTAEVGMSNGVLEGCRGEAEDVVAHAIHKPDLSEENLKLNEDKMDINCGGSESCVDDDDILPGSEQCEGELLNAPLDVADHAPELPVEDHELEIRDIHEIRDEGHSSECLLSDNKEIDCELVENVEDKVESPRLIDGKESIERDLVGDNLESPCSINFVGNNELEQRPPLVAEVQEITSPEVMTGNDEKNVQCSASGDFVENSELEQGSQNSESRCQNLEIEDNACGHIIDEEKQSEPANKGQNDEIEIDCLPNGDSELEPRLNLNDDNELFDNEDNGILTEDMDGQQVDEVHHGKNEISDPESSDCNVSNIGGFSDVLDKNSGGYNHTVQPDMQEGVLAGSNGLSTPVSENEQKPEVTKKKLPCLVKIPRHLDNKIRSQIKLAQMHLDQKTQIRDFIKAAIQMRRSNKEEMIERLRAARQEERAFREAIKSKRQEMEPVQLTLNRVKNATSVEEFDEKIYQMQYRIEHESMPLREEKQLLREMKMMKLNRDQLCAITGSHSELKEAFDHIDKIQERSKLLGQELDSLKKQAFQAEKNVQAIEKEFGALNSDLRQLQDDWNDADSVRQEAYEALKAVKKKEYERNIEFHQTRSNIQSARQYALSGQREALDKLCSDQVERIMEIWNKNVEFRKEYVKDNEMSILKRLGTLDGRSLGPDEEPPLPTNYSDDIDPSLLSQKPSASSIRSAPEVQPLPMAIPQQSNQMELETNGQQSLSSQVAVPERKAAGKPKKSQPQLSRLILEIESFEVSPEPSKVKEEDLAKKEEEAAKMKEKIREGEMRKAKEAEDRKKRQAERANAKALARAQREAERKEKEKQKKANKKAAAAAAAATAANTAGNDTPLPPDKVESSASRDIKSSSVEGKEATPETQKPAKPQRRKPVSQNAKPKIPFPAPPKKGRKGLQTWMWIILAVCFCLAIMILWFYF